jgi:hypothetical protein
VPYSLKITAARKDLGVDLNKNPGENRIPISANQ